ncbi:bifunctional diaminohydroxyphosphoribosylaminopyrimidine deaminase/5-amino-6-(5-phosphoribosylamino)uracil reductase RibD [Candidatus Woesearchaeota archaeon]|nr:bifunctional diaminohydroxyphosphoribosylaminopyrimidine deaminase/5-amino-6-(5-phosphoribosylamino)uracil reductase RibD [Candidatus Woesearchaeota archaeon]
MIPHKKFMEMALELACKGKGLTSPNPMVGCIIIKRGRIVGRGFHKKAGEAHAEVIALKEAGKKAKDGILYCTLEPCSHWGRTPPCTEQIVQSGIREVVIGSADPNPLVSGYEELKARGLKARIGILKDACDRLNEYFFKWIKAKRPFVIVKAAMSLDGKIATRTGDSKYISGTEARKFVHQLRSEVDAVMVGINTAMKDDPELTVRLVKGRNPKKIIVDSFLQIRENAHVIRNEPEKLIIATSKKANKVKIKSLQLKGVKIITVAQEKGMLDLKDLMKELGHHEITSVMIEGGAELNAQALKAGTVDKILFFISPRMIGKGLAAVGDLGISKVDKSIQLRDLDYRKIGKDILIEGYL